MVQQEIKRIVKKLLVTPNGNDLVGRKRYQ